MRRAALVSRMQRTTLGTVRRAVLTVLLVIAAAGCGGSDSASPAADPATPTADGVSNLTKVDQLRDAFEADDGRARLVVLLSPT
jgi:hypothetical protein